LPLVHHLPSIDAGVVLAGLVIFALVPTEVVRVEVFVVFLRGVVGAEVAPLDVVPPPCAGALPQKTTRKASRRVKRMLVFLIGQVSFITGVQSTDFSRVFGKARKPN